MRTMMAAELLFGIHVRHRLAEETRNEGKIKQADQEPGNATDQRIQAQISPEYAGHAGADQGQDDVMKYLPGGVILLVLEGEMSNHGKIDKSEGDKRAEVDDRCHQLQGSTHGPQRHHP